MGCVGRLRHLSDCVVRYGSETGNASSPEVLCRLVRKTKSSVGFKESFCGMLRSPETVATIRRMVPYSGWYLDIETAAYDELKKRVSWCLS